MRHLKLPLGISDFEEIRKNEYYYIDKSGLIPDLLESCKRAAALQYLYESIPGHFYQSEKGRWIEL